MKSAYYIGLVVEVIAFLAFAGFMVMKDHPVFAAFGVFGAFCTGYCVGKKDGEK